MNKKSRCVADLRRRILSLDIAPGSDLDEVSLSEQYGISHRLAGDGYVRLEENRGAKVVSMDLSVMRVFFQTAPLVYASIARLAAENRTSVQVAALKEIQLGFVAATRVGKTADAAMLNHQFHETIGEMAQNPYLVASLKRTDEVRVGKAVDQHDAMIAAIEAREPALATDLTLQHWDLSRDQMEKFVRPDPLPIDVISMKDRRHAL